MKHIIFALLSVLWIVPDLYAQHEYKEYHSAYFKKDFEVMLGDRKQNGDFSFYITVQPADGTKSVSISLSKAKVHDFIIALNIGREIYLKWKQTAIENHVSELDKDMNVVFPLVTSCFYYGSSWNFDFSTKVKARFKIIDDDFVLILSSGELKSSNNQFITCDGFYIVFKHVDELDAFIDTLDLEEAEKFLDKKSTLDSLFD